MNFGKGIIIVVNKWDLVEKDNTTFNRYLKEIKFKFSYAPYAPILFVSALTRTKTSEIYMRL
jgi:GTPase der